MEYAHLAAYFDRLESTSKRLEMTSILCELLGQLEPADVEPMVRLLQGKVRPDWEGVELGLAEKMILRVLSDASGADDALVVYHDKGDLGLAAEILLQGGGQQATLFGPEPLQVDDVYRRLLQIAATEGSGSQDTKQKLLHRLLSDAKPIEARYIVRTVAGRLRLGVADMTFLDALAAWRLGRGVRSVQDMPDDERAEHEAARAALEQAYDRCSDLARVACAAFAGQEAIDAISIAHGTPLRPMAAERLKTVADILEKHEGTSAVETKYDGLRLQCHVDAEQGVRLFSRRMEELTAQFPDVQEALAKACRAQNAIVEGEVVAIDPETGALRPFQEISRRRGRKTGLGEGNRNEASFGDGQQARTVMDDIPVAVFLFDCLAANGKSIMNEPYEARRAAIEEAFQLDQQVQLSTMEICSDVAQVEAVFLQAVQDGGEGIMCKSLSGIYKAGNRGFDWIKYKTDYTDELVDTMDLVAVGAFMGRGRRAGWYGALLMACRDEETGKFASVCKLGTGFDDATLQSLEPAFRPHVAPGKPSSVDSDMVPDVWFEPALVMEVQAAEITLSPIHKAAWNRHRAASGLAARFPRFTRWRDDKSPDQATSVGELEQMFEQQRK